MDRAKEGKSEKEGEKQKHIGMAMKPAAAARPTAPAARADEAERRTSPTEMESHTVGPMGRIAIMAVWYAPTATPTTTLMPHGTTAWAATPGTASESSNLARVEVKQQQQQQGNQYGNFMPPLPCLFKCK